MMPWTYIRRILINILNLKLNFGQIMSQVDNATVSAHLSHVRIVMVNTTLPANIGSALRAMKTKQKTQKK